MLRLPPSPTLYTNPFLPSHTATVATAATPAQRQPFVPPTQPSVPVTLRAQTLQVAPTHASAVTPGATTFQLPPPAQPVTTTYQVPPPAQPLHPPTPLASTRPTVLPREAIDWDFYGARLRCIQSTRGADFYDASSREHRLWGLFAPDSDPSVAFVQARAATTSASDKLIRVTNTVVLALRHPHNNAGRDYVWNPTESRLNATAHPNPLQNDGRAHGGDAGPSHRRRGHAGDDPLPSTRTTTARSGRINRRRTSRRYALIRRGGHAAVHTTRTPTVPDQRRRRRLPGHIPRQRQTGDEGDPHDLRRIRQTVIRHTPRG